MHTCLINNKKYIGITSQSTAKRWGLGSGYKKQSIFYNAIKRYGWNNFKHEILLHNLTLLEANLFERLVIKYYKSANRKYGYNEQYGGNSNGKHSISTRKKISKSRKGKCAGAKHVNFGKHLSQNIRNKIGKSNQGKIRTEEMKEKNRIAHLDKHHTEITKQKISTIMKMKNINQGEQNPMYGKIPKNAKKIICVENNQVFNSITEAADKLNLDFRLISLVCNGKRHTTGGLHFKFIEG